MEIHLYMSIYYCADTSGLYSRQNKSSSHSL